MTTHPSASNNRERSYSQGEDWMTVLNNFLEQEDSDEQEPQSHNHSAKGQVKQRQLSHSHPHGNNINNSNNHHSNAQMPYSQHAVSSPPSSSRQGPVSGSEMRNQGSSTSGSVENPSRSPTAAASVVLASFRNPTYPSVAAANVPVPPNYTDARNNMSYNGSNHNHTHNHSLHSGGHHQQSPRSSHGNRHKTQQDQDPYAPLERVNSIASDRSTDVLEHCNDNVPTNKSSRGGRRNSKTSSSVSTSETQPDSKSERKRKREKERREHENEQIEILTKLLKKVEEYNFLQCSDDDDEHEEEEEDGGNTGDGGGPQQQRRSFSNTTASLAVMLPPSNRVDLISRTIAVMDKMHSANRDFRQKVKLIRKEVSKEKERAKQKMAEVMQANASNCFMNMANMGMGVNMNMNMPMMNMPINMSNMNIGMMQRQNSGSSSQQQQQPMFMMVPMMMPNNSPLQQMNQQSSTAFSNEKDSTTNTSCDEITQKSSMPPPPSSPRRRNRNHHHQDTNSHTPISPHHQQVLRSPRANTNDIPQLPSHSPSFIERGNNGQDGSAMNAANNNTNYVPGYNAISNGDHESHSHQRYQPDYGHANGLHGDNNNGGREIHFSGGSQPGNDSSKHGQADKGGVSANFTPV